MLGLPASLTMNPNFNYIYPFSMSPHDLYSSPTGLWTWVLACSLILSAMSAPAAPLTEEARVPSYSLPDVLRPPAGQPITTAADWEHIARPALLASFETFIYGQTPTVADLRLSVETTTTQPIFGGKALLHQTRLRLARGGQTASLAVLIAVPVQANTTHPVPALVGLNFWGNHTIDPDPSILISSPAPGMDAKARGLNARRWNLENLVDRGYAVATAYRGEIAPDTPEQFHTGILALFPENVGDDRMGAIGAWAWALSRIADHLATLPEIDSARLTVVGHSRLGKAALWAAAQDERFSAVFANGTGCLGAALSRRQFGETVAIITRNFPYWFAPRLANYADRVNELPIDQHQLLALIAPRPLHLGSAEQDLWADPRGELLALRHAAPAYALYGIAPVLPEVLPPPDALPVGTVLRFHRREGKHDILPSDWQAHLGAPGALTAP